VDAEVQRLLTPAHRALLGDGDFDLLRPIGELNVLIVLVVIVVLVVLVHVPVFAPGQKQAENEQQAKKQSFHTSAPYRNAHSPPPKSQPPMNMPMNGHCLNEGIPQSLRGFSPIAAALAGSPKMDHARVC
jgi:hypothetical protein